MNLEQKILLLIIVLYNHIIRDCYYNSERNAIEAMLGVKNSNVFFNKKALNIIY